MKYLPWKTLEFAFNNMKIKLVNLKISKINLATAHTTTLFFINPFSFEITLFLVHCFFWTSAEPSV